MKITLAQLNTTIGDFSGNTSKLISALRQAEKDGSDLLVATELSVTGYPPRDLLDKAWFIEIARHELFRIVAETKNFPNIGLIVGCPIAASEKDRREIYNSAILIRNGEILLTQFKSLLPTYDVFDEARYFTAADNVEVVAFKDEILGISICEDAWNDPELLGGRCYPVDPIQILVDKGATVLINISASPFHAGKDTIRLGLLSNHASKHNVPMLYVNQVGANDELIFDGCSMFIDREGAPVRVLKSFEEEILTVNTSEKTSAGSYVPRDELESIHDALVLGVRDYFSKCGFQNAVVGLSGGIDSALTVAIAVEALGCENVMGVTMPSPFSSPVSAGLSKELASNLNIEFSEIPITDIYRVYETELNASLDLGDEIGVTLENIQARIRGNILMAISNRHGKMVLTTGNKSEQAVGYCTLYGDMVGGLSVISDVPKTMVYKLAEFINRGGEVIPAGIIERAPTAELRPNQKDQDTLPPYEILDAILELYIDDGKSIPEIVSAGFDEETVKWVVRAVHRNEFKRRQAAPGLKVTSKAFGVGRRMPIAAKYHEF